MLFSFAVGVLSVVLMHVLSDGYWLPSARDQALTAVAPFGKALFGMAVIPLTASFALSLYFVRTWRHVSSLRGIISLVLLLLSGVLLFLLYQRGFLVMALIAFAFLLDRDGVITYRRLAVFAVAAVILIILVRPLATLMVTGQMPEIQVGLKHQLLYAPNFDTPDVWPVVMAYVNENGFLKGQTFLAIPLRFASPGIREQWDIFTAVDVVNAYYQGRSYFETLFGFNVSLPQELFLNFGLMGLFFTVFAGLATAKMDAWLWRVQPRHVFFIYAIFAAFFTGGFMGELGGILQWILAYLALGLVVNWFSRIRLLAFTGTERLSNRS
jgi:hypothetical protein